MNSVIYFYECDICYDVDIKGYPHYFNEEIELCLDCALDNNYIDKDFYVILAYYSFDIKLNERYKLVEKDTTNYKSVLSCDDRKYEIVDVVIRHRDTSDYKEWRTNVFKRDYYTCQHCNQKSGKLNAHHIKSYKDYPELRIVLDNGITLCYDCHKKEHKRIRGETNDRMD